MFKYKLFIETVWLLTASEFIMSLEKVRETSVGKHFLQSVKIFLEIVNITIRSPSHITVAGGKWMEGRVEGRVEGQYQIAASLFARFG